MLLKMKRYLSVFYFFALLMPFIGFAQENLSVKSISLNGKWEMGFGRKYTSTVIVPGIHNDPAKISNEVLWYKNEIKLPLGKWTGATLKLNGARFRPQIYINGTLVGEQEGGMAPVFFQLKHPYIRPGQTITLEIALASLKNVPQTDASYTPGSDQWRSDVSSGLWDEVSLHLHGKVNIERIIPFINYDAQKVSFKFDLNSKNDFRGKAEIKILDHKGKILLTGTKTISGAHDSINVLTKGILKNWSPKNPNLYQVQLKVFDDQARLMDKSSIPFGLKKFEIRNKKFYLNNQPFIAKGGTIVWHRWVRSKEGRALGYDSAWFQKNIIQLSKDHGANYLRFHLGLPPEKFLDMCDKNGLVVQYEWNFFHGMPASKESLLIQYKSWLDLAMRHPSVCLIHPYNETVGDQLKTVWTALDQLLSAYPALILEDRDVIHIHKYWWSMFENVGLYYDDANVFPKAIMADEFGGNYLDENGDLGGYPSLKESYLRFLGRKHTKEERLEFQAASNARIAEYWRRIGAAGFAPFCALGSNEDGNTWFLGPLKEGKPKPVWDALTASFSPRSVSIDLWDKNFEPAQTIKLPVYLFNDESDQATLSVLVTVADTTGKVLVKQSFSSQVKPFSQSVEQVPLNLPGITGRYLIKAELLNPPKEVKYPVISKWAIHIFKAKVPDHIQNIRVGISSSQKELSQFLDHFGIKKVALNDPSADMILTSKTDWNELANGDSLMLKTLANAIAKGKSVVMLDVGDRPLGQGYPKKSGDLGPLQGVASVYNAKVNTYQLFNGISLKFTETAEPESYIHPDRENSELWYNLPADYTRIWNGLRGGLIVPASNMEFKGLSADAFIAQWQARGAEKEKIKNGSYYAYELQGFYSFSALPNDEATKKKLKDKVYFLVQDAPSLSNSINLNTPVLITDLSKTYQDSKSGLADKFIPLASSAKNLTQTPIALIGFGTGKGKLIVSQLLTSGRLAKGFGEEGLYGIRYDEATVQYVLNMMSLVIK